jgi:SAM-dependent methyltransferase
MAAKDYAAFRPGYPLEAVAFIREAAALDSHSAVIDLAAGTGLMTRLLSPVGRLIAVEPVAEMRAALLTCAPEAEVLEGTAERVPLASAIADAVVVAQAFHWFANEAAVREIARLLKPGGALFLVWNDRNRRYRLMRELEAILAPYRSASPHYRRNDWRRVFARSSSPLKLVRRRTFPFDEPLTLGHLKGRTRSVSYVVLSDEQSQARLMLELERLVGSPDGGAPFLMRYRTEVFEARLR